MTTESARLVGLLADLADFFEPNDLSASSIIRQAATLIRSQAEELERLRSDITRQMAIANSECNRAERLRALIGVWEKNYANQERLPPEFETAIYSNLEGLYEDSAPPKAAPEQEPLVA